MSKNALLFTHHKLSPQLSPKNFKKKNYTIGKEGKLDIPRIV